MKYAINHEYVSIGSQSATHRIILLHGWGADADDLLPIGEAIVKDIKFDFEIISIRAPYLVPESNGRQWYGLYPPQWREADEEVKKLIQTIKEFDNNISLQNSVLLGFSQGAAMSVAVGSYLKFGLIISCSGYPHPNWDPEKISSNIIFSHGTQDNIVPIEASREMFLETNKIVNGKSEIKEFAGGHQINSELINIFNLRLKDVF